MNIGYARVSTDEQNLDLQIDALNRAGCDTIFRDEGVFAVAKSRPQFTTALEALNPGDKLTVWKMDRAFRSLLDALQMLEKLKAQKVAFVSLTDAIDTNTPMGRFAYQIINAFGELERALISERTKAGMQAARERGVVIGRPKKLEHEQLEWAKDQVSLNNPTLEGLAEQLGISARTLRRYLR